MTIPSPDDIVATIDLTAFERDGILNEVNDWIKRLDTLSKPNDANPKWAQFRDRWIAFRDKLGEPK